MSRESKAKPQYTPGEVVSTERVLVRTYSAGVHYGELHSVDGTKVRLVNARRIWRWRGANSLNELALHGIEHSDKGFSRVSEAVPWIDLHEAIETFLISAAALKILDACGWAE